MENFIAGINELTKKWNNLRTVYLRRRKKQVTKSGSGTSDDLDTWYDDDKELTDQLDFLEPYVTINRSRSNMVYL